jgi:probable 2-oxoglutarate dehydrogenase E1 component DHKTD1
MYCGSVSAEFDHITCENERLWCFENYERIMNTPVTNDERIKAMQLLNRTELMEKFMQKKFATHKRYSSEGSEAITIAINTLIAEASRPDAKKELESVVLGMPHRGRLATLVVLNDYPFRNLLYKASGKNDIPEEIVDRIDDIPTHIAVSNTKKFTTSTQNVSAPNRKTTLTMVHNPSHLESQNAISMGKTRAKLDDLASPNKSVLNI